MHDPRRATIISAPGTKAAARSHGVDQTASPTCGPPCGSAQAQAGSVEQNERAAPPGDDGAEGARGRAPAQDRRRRPRSRRRRRAGRGADGRSRGGCGGRAPGGWVRRRWRTCGDRKRGPPRHIVARSESVLRPEEEGPRGLRAGTRHLWRAGPGDLSRRKRRAGTEGTGTSVSRRRVLLEVRLGVAASAGARKAGASRCRRRPAAIGRDRRGWRTTVRSRPLRDPPWRSGSSPLPGRPTPDPTLDAGSRRRRCPPRRTIL